MVARRNQRYEQDIDRSTIVVVCQPTPLPKLGRSCVRLWGYFLIIPHGQPKLGISWRVVGWIFFNTSTDRQPIKQLSLLNQGRKPAADFSNLVLTHISGPCLHGPLLLDKYRRYLSSRSESLTNHYRSAESKVSWNANEFFVYYDLWVGNASNIKALNRRVISFRHLWWSSTFFPWREFSNDKSQKMSTNVSSSHFRNMKMWY